MKARYTAKLIEDRMNELRMIPEVQEFEELANQLRSLPPSAAILAQRRHIQRKQCRYCSQKPVPGIQLCQRHREDHLVWANEYLKKPLSVNSNPTHKLIAKYIVDKRYKSLADIARDLQVSQATVYTVNKRLKYTQTEQLQQVINEIG